MGALGQQLKGLGEQQTRLDRETNALSSALRNNKVRGAWGEAQLRNIVESAGLLEHVDFDTQVVVTDADGHVQRPDMIIHMPGGKKTIPIDAKAPYADYQRACEIPDTAPAEELARKTELLRAHAKAVREHVKTLGAKAYWNAFSDAPDFVIAFIPNESLLQAALETDPTLMDDAFAQKSGTDLADHPVGRAQIRGLRLAAAKPDRRREKAVRSVARTVRAVRQTR